MQRATLPILDRWICLCELTSEIPLEERRKDEIIGKSDRCRCRGCFPYWWNLGWWFTWDSSILLYLSAKGSAGGIVWELKLVLCSLVCDGQLHRRNNLVQISEKTPPLITSVAQFTFRWDSQARQSLHLYHRRSVSTPKDNSISK